MEAGGIEPPNENAPSYSSETPYTAEAPSNGIVSAHLGTTAATPRTEAAETTSGQEFIPTPEARCTQNNGTQSAPSGSEIGPPVGPGDCAGSELYELVAALRQAWPELSPELRQGVAGMLRGVLGTGPFGAGGLDAQAPQEIDVTRCTICDGMVTVHCVLCSRCERAACAGHFVFDPGFEWLCPQCAKLVSGEADGE